MQRHLLGKCCAVLWLCQATLAQAAERTYVAAVYEHSVVLNPRPREPLGRRAALEHMRQNLDMLEKQAAAAARQGAQIIVFPEDAIHGFNYTRESISGYLETVPDPAAVSWSPCSEPDRFPDTEVLHRLSCMALKNALYLVANMPDRQDCDCRLDPRCPCHAQTPCPHVGRQQGHSSGKGEGALELHGSQQGELVHPGGGVH